MQRRPDLVAHTRQELALRPIRRFRIVARLEELGHRDVSVGDVANEADVERALRAFDAGHRELGGELPAVPGARGNLVSRAAPRRRGRIGTGDACRPQHIAHERVVKAGWDEAGAEVLAHGVRSAHAEHALRSAVELHDVATFVEGDDTVVRRVEHRAAAAVAVLELCALGPEQIGRPLQIRERRLRRFQDEHEVHG
ncbi:MAG: hypothetical protein QM736_24160 [Vicinamibacterales bacterium]